MTPWTEEHIETLIRLWPEFSASEVAAELSSLGGHFYTRNAVVGKANRLGLAKRDMPPIRSKKFAYKEPKPRQPPKQVLVKATPRPAYVAPTAVTPKNLSIMELTSTTCRWPIGDPRDGMSYCGCQKSATDSYCAHHMAVAYMAPVDRATRAAAKLRDSLRRAA
jgi:GcrA cell cycle regulator